MVKLRSWSVLAVLGMGLLCVAVSPRAAFAVSYPGPFESDTVIFSAVQDLAGTFNTPVVNGDTIDFNPSLSASAFNGQGTNFDQISFTVDRKGDFVIDEVEIDTSGLLNLLSAGASGLVNVNAVLDVTDTTAGGVAALDPVSQAFNDTFTSGTSWSAPTLSFNIADILAPLGPPYDTASATQIQVSVAVFLQADGPNGFSNISLNNTEGMIFTVLGPGSQIPEPATALMLAGGLAGLALSGRKRAR